MENTDPIIKDSRKIVATLGNLCKKEGLNSEFEILSRGECQVEYIDHDGWNGGTDIYGLFCRVPLDLYSAIEYELDSIEKTILDKAEKIFKAYHDNVWFTKVSIAPILSNEIHGKTYRVQSKELLEKVEAIKEMMVSVATGKPIQEVNEEYIKTKAPINEGLKERNIDNPIVFNDLWDWYRKWRDGSLPTYQSRREFLSELFTPLLEQLEIEEKEPLNPIFTEPTGWDRVDRSLKEIKTRMIEASNEEQYQTVGLLCRETLISLGQFVYDAEIHKTSDGVLPSKKDAKRLLEAYFNTELKGKSNETVRKHARASNDLANELTHKRTADYRLAALSAEATNAVINIVAIISGRRDPQVKQTKKEEIEIPF